MCLIPSRAETERVKAENKPITAYKVVKVDDDRMTAIYRQAYKYNAGTNVSSRGTTHVTEFEWYSHEVHEGFHVCFTAAEAEEVKRVSLTYWEYSGYYDEVAKKHKVIKVDIKACDVVAVGSHDAWYRNSNRLNQQLVVTEFTISQEEYDKALCV